MKIALCLISFALYTSAGTLNNSVPRSYSTYGYLRIYAIPAAERIREAEKVYLRKKTSMTRITGGLPALSGQFKYQAGLISDIVDINNKGICGGSLLTINRVLTAAHCWYDGENQAWRFTVVLGSQLLFFGGTRILTSDVTTHIYWFPSFNVNDIAIIRLPEPVILSDSIGTVSLPVGLEVFNDLTGEIATASGFGYTSDGANVTENQSLNYVNMTVISNAVCNVFYAGGIRSSNICTNTVEGSTCHGDSGGPLVINKNGMTYIIGVTSFGSSFGCEVGWPAAFVRITSFLKFIYENL
ncbi:chymotrypsin [Danaus plexippus plexippus]|uniref:Chymotrypsin n=1 Tax=Danaus plexippus plexippus TaxID=278856 RepID=A0A212ES10_DANPL|nr:brachyurin-like [Danaus plexippus plexippus]OWR44234.1 chymotrypsin [Danaus plexippus plexippus]